MVNKITTRDGVVVQLSMKEVQTLIAKHYGDRLPEKFQVELMLSNEYCCSTEYPPQNSVKAATTGQRVAV